MNCVNCFAFRRRPRSGSGSLCAPVKFRLYERDRKPGELDVNVLHQHLLGSLLGISEEAVRDEKHIEYVRGLDAAYAKVREDARMLHSCWSRPPWIKWPASLSQAE